MFQTHNPAQPTVNWYCDLIGANQNNASDTAKRLLSMIFGYILGNP